jgi:hypothetical protein
MNTASAISRNNQSPEAPRTRFASENPKRSGSDASLELRPLVALSPSTLHIVAIPLIILSTLAVGFMLVYLKEILVPFVVAMFFVYLLRPLVELLTRPCASCCHESCIDSGYVHVDLIALFICGELSISATAADFRCSCCDTARDEPA